MYTEARAQGGVRRTSGFTRAEPSSPGAHPGLHRTSDQPQVRHHSRSPPYRRADITGCSRSMKMRGVPKSLQGDGAAQQSIFASFDNIDLFRKIRAPCRSPGRKTRQSVSRVSGNTRVPRILLDHAPRGAHRPHHPPEAAPGAITLSGRALTRGAPEASPPPPAASPEVFPVKPEVRLTPPCARASVSIT